MGGTYEESDARDDSICSRVLVIDDEPAILSFVSRALTAHGFDVDCAQDGLDGLSMVRAGEYGLIVLDLVMPGFDGIATLEALRSESPEQPVLVLSAVSDTASTVHCLELGADDYLTKPFAIAELVARVRRRMRALAQHGAVRFARVGDVTLDLQRHVADAGAGEVSLSSREFELLLHLMRRAGVPCSREQLLADVWGTSFDPGTNVVDVYVRRLRRKLGSECIETKRNVGYALRAA